MSKPNQKIRIPLPEDEALELLLKVKPAAGMPRQAAKTPKADRQKKVELER
ncbi:MAG: hypothetical protein P8Z30_15745 [Acidobacteriota bacterium]